MRGPRRLGPGRVGVPAVGLSPACRPQVNRQVAQCNCAKRFQVEQISANRYRVSADQRRHRHLLPCRRGQRPPFPSPHCAEVPQPPMPDPWRQQGEDTSPCPMGPLAPGAARAVLAGTEVPQGTRCPSDGQIWVPVRPLAPPPHPPALPKPPGP